MTSIDELLSQEVERLRAELAAMREQHRDSEHFKTAIWVTKQGQRELRKLEKAQVEQTPSDNSEDKQINDQNFVKSSKLNEHEANEAFDLTPISMRSNDEPSNGKPHVDSIVSPKHRTVPMNRITADALIKRRQALKSVAGTETQIRDDEMHNEIIKRRTSHENEHSEQKSSLKRSNSLISIPMQLSPLPPPHPLPPFNNETTGREQNQKNKSEGRKQKSLKRINSINDLLQSSEDEAVIPSDSASQARKKATNKAYQQKKSVTEKPIKTSNSHKLLEKEEKNTGSISELSQGKPKSKSSETQESSRSRRSSESHVSFDLGSEIKTSSQHSSANSECEVDEVDIEGGADLTIQGICNKFTINGPFYDDELNALHLLCSEYTSIASLTLGRQGVFSRSKPHHERVYLYLSSNRRSKWFDTRKPITPSSESRLLDFIFRKILRSRSLVIRDPRMQLDGLDKDRRLSLNRFKRVMQRAFQRRKALIEAAVGSLINFELIV